MAVETTILPVIEKLRELKDSKKIIVQILGSRVENSMKILSQVLDCLKDQEGSSIVELLQTVYRAEDTIDVFLKEISKEFYQQKLFVKAFPAGIHLRSVYIQTSFGDKMGKLVGDVEAKSRKLFEDAALNSRAAGNDDPDKKTGRLGLNDKKNDMLGLKDEVKELAELMLTGYSSPFIVSVVDVAGSAKTTELLKMYECEDIKNYFQCRAWSEVPEELDNRELVKDILKQIAGSEVEEKLPFVKSMQQELRNFLIQKRYIVVLTDVRAPDIWEILQFLFPNSWNGSRVILSFREADAARHRNVKFFGRNLSLNPKNMRVAVDIREDDVGDGVREPVSDVEILKEETDIVGLQDQILELARLTLNGGKKYFIISVMGVAGSGKTTLVKTIYNSSYTRQNFDCRAWGNVYVSNDFDMKNILSNILQQITQVKVEEELPVLELKSKLSECLHEKRYLIVLDDVHLPGAWYELERIFSPKSSSNGSRVILITREARIARSFSPSILHNLRLLNEDESCQLFLKKVERDESSPEILGKIWKISGGLPLAISVLGGLLSPLPHSEWSDVIKQIMSGRKKKRKQLAASDDDDESISPDELASWDTSSIWDLGYKFLSPHLRACLNYLCFFPESMVQKIPVRRLLQLWLAERLLTPTEGENMSLEDRVKKGFEQLKNRNMIEIVQERLDGRPKTCRVPSSLYVILSANAKHMGFFHMHHDRSRSEATSSIKDFCVRRLAEHLDNQNNTSPSDDHFKYLHSYISFDNRIGDKPAEEVGHFLNKTITKRGYGLLRVLDLEGVYKPKLPKTIGKLRLLRYVGLRWTFLDSVPESVGDLPCLETLDVKHTNITTLPMSIWKAKTLRHLFMNDIHFKMSIQKPFVKYSFSNLQTLWGLLIGNECPPEKWLKGLSNLRKLGLTCHTASLDKITKWIEGLESLESLRLRSINDFGEPSDLNFLSLGNHKMLTELYLLGRLTEPLQISKIPSKLKIFTLSLSHLSEDPMPVLEQLKELNILRLFAHSYMGEEMTCHPGGFPKLRVLKLFVLKELKKWDIKDGAMPALRELEIRNCRKLNKPNGLEKVTTLKELKLTNMEKKFIDEVRASMPKSLNIDLPLDKKTRGVEASG